MTETTQPAMARAQMQHSPLVHARPRRGYDIAEFAPEESARDFAHRPARRMRVRVPDEERAHLRRVAMEFAVGDAVARGPEEDAAPVEMPGGDGSTRLYRD